MRILLKITLLPISLALTVLVGLCRFVCRCAGGLLTVASGLVFIITLLGLLLPVMKLPAASYAAMFALAFAISPFGLPKLAGWLLEKLVVLNTAIRSIGDGLHS